MRLHIAFVLIVCSWLFILDKSSGQTTEEDGFLSTQDERTDVPYTWKEDSSTNEVVQSSNSEFSTDLGEFTTDDLHEVTSVNSLKSVCRQLFVYPYESIRSVGENATFTCTCKSSSDCPKWRNVQGMPRLESWNIFDDHCIATLTLFNIRGGARNRLTCTGVNSRATAYALLRVKQNTFDGKCRFDGDCLGSYRCKNSRCSCPDNKPIHVADFKDTCLPVAKLLGSCLYTVQCQGNDRNSYCYRDLKSKTEMKTCACRAGYQNEDGLCVSTDSVFSNAYQFTMQYKLVFYGFISICSAFILLGLLRICMVRRRDVARRTGRSAYVSSLDGPTLTTTAEKRRF